MNENMESGLIHHPENTPVKSELESGLQNLFNSPAYQDKLNEAVEKYQKYVYTRDHLASALRSILMNFEDPEFAHTLKVTGDLHEDASNLFEKIHATKLTEKLASGEDPKTLLFELSLGMKVIRQNKDQEDFKPYVQKASIVSNKIDAILENDMEKKIDSAFESIFDSKRFKSIEKVDNYISNLKDEKLDIQDQIDRKTNDGVWRYSREGKHLAFLKDYIKDELDPELQDLLTKREKFRDATGI